MFRKSLKDLLTWKNSKARKPLIIRGARQIGKTWLMKEFRKTNYEKVAYINFDNNERMESLFSGHLDIERIITALQIETGVKIRAQNTLIIFDEVQEVPRALTSLKYFCENAPEYHIIAAGSLLGVALHPGTSFPVGKVEFLELYPLNFLEFLSAMGNEALVELLISKDFSLITSFKGKYIDLLKQYYYIGLKSLLEGNKLFEEFKGALTEQYVLQQLIASRPIFYLHATDGRRDCNRILVLQYSIKAHHTTVDHTYGYFVQG